MPETPFGFPSEGGICGTNRTLAWVCFIGSHWKIKTKQETSNSNSSEVRGVENTKY